MVRGVREFYEANPEEATRMFDEIHRISTTCIELFKTGNDSVIIGL